MKALVCLQALGSRGAQGKKAGNPKSTRLCGKHPQKRVEHAACHLSMSGLLQFLKTGVNEIEAAIDLPNHVEDELRIRHDGKPGRDEGHGQNLV